MGADLGGRAIAVALEDPAPVVLVLEGVEGAAEVLDGVEAPEPEQVLLQDADEALDAAVALGLADERGRAFEAEEVELALEVVGDELAAVIVAEPGAGGDGFAERAEAVAPCAVFLTAPPSEPDFPPPGARPGAAAPGPRSGWPGGRHGRPGTRRNSDRRRRRRRLGPRR